MLVGVIVFSLALAFLATHYMMSYSIDTMVGMSEINESSGAVNALQAGKTVLGRLDFMVLAVFLGLVLALLITGWFVGGHPVFMVLYFIAVIVFVIVSAILSNVWDDVISGSVLASSASSFAVTNHLLSYLPYYMGVVGILGFIVMFAKPGGDGVG